MIANKLMKKYYQYKRITNCYFADSKSQLSVKYQDDKPQKITTIVISYSNTEELINQKIKSDIKTNAKLPVLAEYAEFDKWTNLIINLSDKFTILGSIGDSGCISRKIVVDIYSGTSKVGDGGFSYKNATKVDRSGAYYVRLVAKNIFAIDLVERS